MECCDVCQRTKRNFDHPAAELHPVPVPSQSWKQIGIDIVGPLPCTGRGNKYVTDYFPKWPEAKASPTKEAAYGEMSGQRESRINSRFDGNRSIHSMGQAY